MASNTCSAPRSWSVVQNVAPVPEKPTITVQEIVARKMLKLRAKLGITADDLLPAARALESERNSEEKAPAAATHRWGAHGGQETPKATDEHVNRGMEPGPATSGGYARGEASGVVDVGRWKKETDDMLSLLGTNADKCTHQYPMTELKRKVPPVRD